MDKKINKWLQKKIKDPFVNDIYSETLLPLIYSGKYDETDYYKYYQDNDIDIQNTDETAYVTKFLIENNPHELNESTLKLSNILEIYGDKVIMLPPNCNQAHTNYLFKLLLDRSKDMIYNVPFISKTGQITHKQIPMIDTSFKNKFYKFCYQYSRH